MRQIRRQTRKPQIYRLCAGDGARGAQFRMVKDHGGAYEVSAAEGGARRRVGGAASAKMLCGNGAKEAMEESGLLLSRRGVE